MKRNTLFPKLNGIMHGGDYNPEQWLDRPDILEKDIYKFIYFYVLHFTFFNFLFN